MHYLLNITSIFNRGGILIYFILFSSFLIYYSIFLSFLELKSQYLNREREKSKYRQENFLSRIKLLGILLYCTPLLGLLGTVQGLAGGFLAISDSTEVYKQLAKHVSQALMTTQFALLVVLPGLILFGLLKRRYSTHLLRSGSQSHAL